MIGTYPTIVNVSLLILTITTVVYCAPDTIADRVNNRESRQIFLVPSLLDPLYYVQIPYQQDVERYADSLEPETRVNVPYGSTESDDSPAGRQYFGITNIFSGSNCPACPPTNSTCKNSTCPAARSAVTCPDVQTLSVSSIENCPAQAFSYAYGSLDLFLTPTVTAAPYICQFTVAVPAPYTQFRIACPLMKGYGLSGTGNIVAYDLGLSFVAPVSKTSSLGPLLMTTVTKSSQTILVSSNNVAVNTIQVMCVWQGF